MIKCLIVDDELLARDLIKSYASKFNNIEIIGEAHSAIEATNFLVKQDVDLLFLDINMPNLTGIEMLINLPKRPLTILCTAHSEYALQSYDLDVVDYLLKPIGLGRFTKAIYKVLDRLEIDNKLINSKTGQESFYVKSDYKKIKIVPNEIKFIEAMEKYVRIHLTDKKVMTLMSMTSIMAYLDKTQFYRVHRSFIINKEAINSIQGNLIVMGIHKIPISRANRNILNKF